MNRVYEKQDFRVSTISRVWRGQGGDHRPKISLLLLINARWTARCDCYPSHCPPPPVKIFLLNISFGVLLG